MTYSSVFGGGTLQTTEVAYRAVTLSANTTLVWPPLSASPTDYAARTMDVVATAGALTLRMPPANQVSPGYDCLISNRGVNNFTVADNAGTTIIVVAPGASKYIQVTDNSTVAGVWNLVSFGAVTSGADAASLVGPSIGASGLQLYHSVPVSLFSASGNTIVPGDRDKTYVWTGGAGTLNLPAAGTVTDFMFELRNQGTGALTLAANGLELVDGASTIVFQPTESAEVHAGVGNWYSVGRGRSVQFSFTLLVKNITGGTVTLTPTEAANVVQKYTGVLVSNANIVLPSVVQVYYVSNQTTGAFTVTFKTAGVGTTISVPSNQNAVLFCDGLNVINSSTTVSGLTALLLAQGSATAPSIGYSGDSSTGIFQPTSGQVAITISGTQRATFATTGLSLPGQDVSAATLTLSGLATAATAPTLPAHLANKAYVDAQVSGGGFVLKVGDTMTGRLNFSNAVAEFVRSAHSTGFLSGYDNAGATRTGYLQFNAAGSVVLAADTGATAGLALYTGGSARVQINATGTVDFLGNSLLGVGNIGGNADSSAWSLWGGRTVGSGGTVSVYGSTHATPNLVVFGRNGTETARFAANGFFGIGATPANIFHVKGSGQLGRFESTTARGGGLCYVDFFDPTGAKGEIGFGAAADDFYVTNILNGALNLGTSNATRIAITGGGVASYNADAAGLFEIGFRGLNRVVYNSGASTLQQTDNGKCHYKQDATNVTVPSTLTDTTLITIYNASGSARTIVQGGGLTLILAGTATTGNRTLAANGLASVWVVGGTAAVISGPGVT